MDEQLDPAGVIEYQGVRLDPGARTVTSGGREVPLTGTEFRLLERLLQSPGQVLSRAELCAAAIGGGAVVLERTIDVHVCALRRKLRAGGLIQTVRGKGYRCRPA